MTRTIALMPPNLNPLWGSELLNVELDLLRQRAELSFRTRSSDGKNDHLFRLICEGVGELRYINAIPGPWAYVDATEAEAEELADGRIRIELVFYDEPSGMVIEAARAALEQEPVP